MKRGSIFETDGIPRIQEALPLALQHVVAMIVGCVTPAIIVAGAAGLENKDQVILIQADCYDRRQHNRRFSENGSHPCRKCGKCCICLGNAHTKCWQRS